MGKVPHGHNHETHPCVNRMDLSYSTGKKKWNPGSLTSIPYHRITAFFFSFHSNGRCQNESCRSGYWKSAMSYIYVALLKCKSSQLYQNAECFLHQPAVLILGWVSRWKSSTQLSLFLNAQHREGIWIEFWICWATVSYSQHTLQVSFSMHLAKNMNSHSRVLQKCNMPLLFSLVMAVSRGLGVQLGRAVTASDRPMSQCDSEREAAYSFHAWRRRVIWGAVGTSIVRL